MCENYRLRMSDEEEYSENEFCYPDELEFQDNSDLTETNYERVGERENEENSQEEIETFVKEQKSINATKKTVSDMKTFQRYLPSNKRKRSAFFLYAQPSNTLRSRFTHNNFAFDSPDLGKPTIKTSSSLVWKFSMKSLNPVE